VARARGSCVFFFFACRPCSGAALV
jgi:hypothetical protein